MVHEQFKHVDEALNNAGLNMTDLGHLTPFNRSTLYNWRAGKKQPHSFYAQTLNGWVALINKAVEHNMLPLTSNVRGEERANTLRKVLREVRSL
jgi:hypothetical protein